MTLIRTAALGTAGVVAAAALVAVVVTQGSDDDTVARDSATPGASATPSASPDAPSATPSAAALEPLDFGAEPALERPYKKLAQRAVRDGLVAMIPAELPSDWTVGGGGYRRAEPTWWRLEMDAPTGRVVMDQLAGTPDEVLTDHRDVLTEQDDVRLEAWETGVWEHYTAEGTTVLTYRLKGSTVVVQATDLETASTLASTLLPAEGRTTSQE